MNDLQSQAGKIERKAENVTNNALEKGREVTGNAKESVDGIVDTLTQKGSELVEGASAVISQTVRSGRDYISDRGLDEVPSKLAGAIKRYPIPSVMVAVIAGYALGQLTSRSER